MISKDEAYKKISDLVTRFEEQYDFYKKSDYTETPVRRDFIDPFLKSLGWDIDNENGYAESYVDNRESRINEIVYQLYGLTEEEIKIVEG